MKLTLNLKPETEAYAIKRAAELEITIDKYVEKLVLEDLEETQNIEGIFEPFREKYQKEKGSSEKHK